MIIVFDTNIWIRELGLRSPSGAVIRFFVRKTESRVALPEVVRLEVERNLAARLREFTEGIRKQHRQLLTAFGRLKDVVLPTNDEIAQKVVELFTGFDEALFEIPLSLESARSSFLKTIDKVPPSDRDQEFKDGVLWADCLGLLTEDDVTLVTEDKAFYEGRSYANGLARNLSEEAAPMPHRISVVSSLADLLSELRCKIEIDRDELIAAFFAQEGEKIERVLARNGFVLGAPVNLEVVPYVTEDADRLFIEFSILFECPDTTAQDRQPARLILSGDCSYVMSSESFVDIRNFGEALKFRQSDGSEKEVKSAVFFGVGAIIGHRDVTNTIRYRLEE